MYIVHDINNINKNDFFFGKSMNNNIIHNGNFIRLLYSNELFTINSLLLKLPIETISIDKNFNKYKCLFNAGKNKELIDKINALEHNILLSFNTRKNKNLNITKQLSSGVIKLFTDEHDSYNTSDIIVLKISGVWETDTDCGITFKFMFLSRF